MKLRTIIEGDAPLSAYEIGIYLPAEPYGPVLISTDDTEDESRELLQRLDRDWNHLWPKLRTELESGLSRYKSIKQRLAEGEFWASAEPLSAEDNQWDADCEICITFNEDGPQWHCFLSGTDIVHFQPVF